MAFEAGHGSAHGCVCPLTWGIQGLVLHYSTDSLSYNFVFLWPASDLEIILLVHNQPEEPPQEQTSVLLGKLQGRIRSLDTKMCVCLLLVRGLEVCI